MNITFAPRDILQIDNARIIYRNFSGVGSKFNREGDRNFSIVVENTDLTMEEVQSFMDMNPAARLKDCEDGGVILTYKGEEIVTIADAFVALGWNVKIKPPREEDDMPFIHLPVKVKFNDRGPTVYLKSGNKKNRLEEEDVGILDDIDILRVDLDIRPYDWEVNGKSGRTAYLQSIEVTQEVDRFAERYSYDD